ncbi:MAG: VanZ family protein [Methanoregulaceae archaeon]|nr:VanZ family protein [Sphaerochaetaceae bacterium]
MNISVSRALLLVGRILSPLILLVLVIFSLAPSDSDVSLISSWLRSDKLAHLLGYAALGCNLMWALARVVPGGFVVSCKANGKRMALVLLVTVLVGGVVEMIQPRYGRSAELLDVAADGIGGMLGIIFGLISLQWAAGRDQGRSS